MADQERLDPRAEMLEKAWATPEARPYLERALKTAYPNAEIPGMALREATEAARAAAAEREAKIDAKIAKFDADRDHDRAVADLHRQGYNDADVKEIEDIMAKEGIGLHVNAAIVYDNRRKVAAPRTPADYRGSMNPKAYGRGQHAAWFNGLMEGDFHHPGEDWARAKADMILQDFQNDRAGAEARWANQDYWPADPNFPLKA
jgi:hypothetical protein